MNDSNDSPANAGQSIAEQHRERLAARRNTPRPTSGASGPIDRAILGAPWLTFTGLIAFGALVTGFISWGMYDLVSPYILANDADTITDQSLASYVGSVFGTSVALAGSFVAIMLAKRAVDLSESQNRLSEQQSGDAYELSVHQTSLAEESVRIADRQSLEAEAASIAAEEYRRLKGMLITFPAILRKAQRDGVFGRPVNEPGIAAERHGIDKLKVLNGVIEPIANTCKRFLESGAPAAIISLAKAIDRAQDDPTLEVIHAVVQDQRYFEFATSSLYYESSHLAADVAQISTDGTFDPLIVRDKFYRVLHGIYHFVNQTDDLICLANKAAALTNTSLLDHDQRFSRQAHPIAELNRYLSLQSDLAPLGSRVMRRKSIDDLELSLFPSLAASALSGESKGGVVLCLHESGLSELLTRIKQLLAVQRARSALVRVDGSNWESAADQLSRDIVPIFLIAENVDANLCRLAAYLAENPAKWPLRVAVVDQADLACDSWTSDKYLTMNGALQAWQSFRALDLVFNEMFVQNPSETREDFISKARYKISNDLQRFVTPSPELFKSNCAHFDDLVVMCEAAARQIDCALAPDEIRAKLTQFEQVVIGFMQNSGEALSDERLGELHDAYALDNIAYQGIRDVISELAKAPFLQRPLYAFNPSIGHLMTGRRNLELPNTALFGTAYCDSNFDIQHSPLLNMLSSSGMGYRLF